jgi:Tfp pilus assembly protein PilF
VRIRPATALAALNPDSLPNPRDRANLREAISEFMAAMRARPDDWASHANLGNFHMESRDFAAAAACFETATKLEPRQIGPMVNASLAYSNMNRNDKAENSLRRALKMDPGSAAANFNLGLLLGEQGRLQEAEQALRTALKSDPQLAAAAYNLGVVLSKRDLDEAVAWCQKAHDLRPDDPKYAHTLAFYQRQNGNAETAVELLREVIRHEPRYLDAYLLLADILEERRELTAAAAVYRQALRIGQLPQSVRTQLEAKVHELGSRSAGE